jgi:putative solute:sodium symporter small subunit
LAIAFRRDVGYNTAPPMHDSKPEKQTDMHSEEFLRELMRKQLKLSITCALVFLVVLLGLPLANYFAPEFMAQRIFGFTLTWFLLGIGFFPAVWVISYYFIKRSIKLEEEEVKEVQPTEKQP